MARWTSPSSSSRPQSRQGLVGQLPTRVSLAPGQRGTKKLLDEYGDRPWIVGTYLRVADIAPQFERLGFIPWIAAAVVVAAFVIAFLLGRGFSRPIRQLAAAATGIRDLDFSGPPVGYHGLFRELNQAASAFNAMVRGLQSFETYVPRTLVRRLVQRHGEGAIVSEERYARAS